MEEKQILSAVADTITEKPKTIDIDVKPKGKWHQLMMKLKLSPTAHHFEIKPQRVVNVYRIAGRAVLLSLGSILEDNEQTILNRVNSFMDIWARHGEDIFYIVACAIQNDHREPTKQILDIVKNDFEVEDLLEVLTIAVGNYNIASFLNSIALIQGVDQLKTKASPEKVGV